MLKKTGFFVLIAFFLFSTAYGQISAKLMRYMDVSDSQITFVYGGDIWIMPKTGGTAVQVTHSPGEESWPRFSPDGKSIAYTASYNGNADVYVMPVQGGIPKRITYQSLNDRMVDWHPRGEYLLFASNRESGQSRLNQFYKVSKNGGFPEKLKIPYGELASYSPDGTYLAYITKITENFPFKRYRGGLASDIIVYNLKEDTAENITRNQATDGKPAWIQDHIYFLSDQGENMRLNIWRYNTKNKGLQQITHFKDFDITYMSAGKNDIVFESGGVLYLLDLETNQYEPVEVNVISDFSVEMPRSKNVSTQIRDVTLSPAGKRVVFEARGELFNVPVSQGYVINMTQTSDAFDQSPAWSPNGKYIAFWSDRSGEYQIYIQKSDGLEKPRQLTHRSKGFGYKLYWSPDSQKIAFIDETNDISVLNITSGEISVVGNTQWNIGHGGRYSYQISWSPDSRWLAFTRGLDNAQNAIFLYDMQDMNLHQATSGFFEDFNPVFSADGKYLFYLTNRNFSAEYSDMSDGTWIYPNSTLVASVSLTQESPSLLAPKNDATIEEIHLTENQEIREENTSKEKTPESVKIDFSGLESRLEILPPKPGNLGGLIPLKGKLVYLRFPNTGSAERHASLITYDLKEREEKTIISPVEQAIASADGKSLLVQSQGKYGIIKPLPKQKIDKPIPTQDLVMNWIPRQEWHQIFNDTWRRYRDFFYDPNMHGVDWSGLRNRYGDLINYARTRWDVTYICSNMAAELSAGHTYTFGGDVEQVSRLETGYLGIDWELSGDKYRIKRIIRPAVWDAEVRSPFDQTGLEVKPGDTILGVNGVDLNTQKEPFASFEGLSGKTVTLTLSHSGQADDSWQQTVKCLTPGQETQLRYLEWIEKNRKMVDNLSDGKLGYIYMSNTSSRGQLELVKMFYGQLDKKGFIIDERFNGGGQLADRFLELLKRPVVYNLHWRHGKDHTQPIKTNTGPMGMLINGWAGSGGDGLPWAFQELEAGPIVGERTLGILVGPATGHQLIDSGGITVPGGRLYDNDGHWFWEGEGVAPDFKVWDDPNLLVKGRDPQIEKVVEEVMKLLEENPPRMTPAPPLEDRTAKGIKKKIDS